MNQPPRKRGLVGVTLLVIAITLIFVLLPPEEPKAVTDETPPSPTTRTEPIQEETLEARPKLAPPTTALPLPRPRPTAPVIQEPEVAKGPSVHIQPASDTRVSSVHDGGIGGNSVGFTIQGKVSLSGAPPPEKEITDLQRNRDCGPLHKEPITTQFYRVGPGGGLADTIVYLIRLQGGQIPKLDPTATKPPVMIDQAGCMFTPAIVALQAGQKLIVRNSDPLMHNVHFSPAVQGNKESNKAQMPKAPDQEYTFNNAEAFLKLRCDVHPWMVAHIFVVDHPFISVTDTNGNFSITNVPPGTYAIEAKHRKAGSVTKEIAITSPGTQVVNFTLQVP